MGDTILLVDDETEILELLEIYLGNAGYQVYSETTAAGALECVGQHGIDMALLDVMLPDGDGFELCRTLRKKYLFPIIMLTAKNEDSDMLNGLTLGADDYITKPFKPIEVVARVRSQLRRYKQYDRTGQKEEKQEIDIRGLYINEATHKALLYGRELALTPIEFRILYYLCAHQGQVVSSEELFEAVWKEKYFDSNNTVMTHIGRLREKMRESARRPKFIKTVWGVGYTIE